MALENNPQYINDLNEAWPVGAQDQKLEGDDHLRQIKRTVKNTFPGMVGRAWRTQAKASGGSVVKNDNMTLINHPGGTLIPEAAATIGNGFVAFIRASGADVTVNPAQPINGADSQVIPDGYMGVLLCDGSEFFLLLMSASVPAETKAFPTGTKMLFQQTTAPLGWVKQTSSPYNNAGLRLTTGSVGTGGVSDFTTIFAAGRTVDNTTLSIAQIPSHSHTLQGANQLVGVSNGWNANLSGDPRTTSSAGGGGSHNHGFNMNLKFVDFIVAEMQ